MTKKYAICSQDTGMQLYFDTYAEALVKKQEFCEAHPGFADQHDDLFAITVIIQNARGYWVQSRCDDNGDPIFTTTS